MEITVRHTVIQTLENTRIIIPNSQMNTAVLENISDIHSSKADFLYVSIAYDSDLEKAISIIQQEVAAHPKYCDPRSEEDKKNNMPAVIVRVTDFKAASNCGQQSTPMIIPTDL